MMARYQSQQTAPETPFFYSDDGRKIKIRAISLIELFSVEQDIIQEFKDTGKYVELPTYSVTTASGKVVTHDLTVDNLTTSDEVETERRQTEWAKYTAYKDELTKLVGSVQTDILMDGIDETPANDDWLALKKRRHIRVPEDPDQRLSYWKATVVLKTPGDLIHAQQEIILLSSSGSVSRKEIEAAGESFLRPLQDQGNGPAIGVAVPEGSGGDTAAEPLGAQPVVRRHARGKRVGSSSEHTELMQAGR